MTQRWNPTKTGVPVTTQVQILTTTQIPDQTRGPGLAAVQIPVQIPVRRMGVTSPTCLKGNRSTPGVPRNQGMGSTPRFPRNHDHLPAAGADPERWRIRKDAMWPIWINQIAKRRNLTARRLPPRAIPKETARVSPLRTKLPGNLERSRFKSTKQIKKRGKGNPGQRSPKRGLPTERRPQPPGTLLKKMIASGGGKRKRRKPRPGKLNSGLKEKDKKEKRRQATLPGETTGPIPEGEIQPRVPGTLDLSPKEHLPATDGVCEP